MADPVNFWLERIQAVPLFLIEQWIREQYPDCKNLFFDDDFYKTGAWFWESNTLMCHLHYGDPPVWLVLRTWAWWSQNPTVMPFSRNTPPAG